MKTAQTDQGKMNTCQHCKEEIDYLYLSAVPAQADNNQTMVRNSEYGISRNVRWFCPECKQVVTTS